MGLFYEFWDPGKKVSAGFIHRLLNKLALLSNGLVTYKLMDLKLLQGFYHYHDEKTYLKLIKFRAYLLLKLDHYTGKTNSQKHSSILFD